MAVSFSGDCDEIMAPTKLQRKHKTQENTQTNSTILADGKLFLAVGMDDSVDILIIIS
jgi:hypothetical protein